MQLGFRHQLDRVELLLAGGADHAHGDHLRLLCASAQARQRADRRLDRRQARVPHAVRRLLKDALKLREQRDRPISHPDGSMTT